MVDVFINILEDIEHQLGLGKDTSPSLRELGMQLRDKMNMLADSLEKLEKKGWSWNTGAKDIYLHRASISDEKAKKELLDAGVPESLFHFVH